MIFFEKGACTHGALSSWGRFAFWTVGVDESCCRRSCGFGVMIPLWGVNGVSDSFVMLAIGAR